MTLLTTKYLALVHYPIVNKRAEIVTTSVTNLDIHDIARSARTFGYKEYGIITPIMAQQQLVQRILGHWHSDKGNDYNPDRSDALSSIAVYQSLQDFSQKIYLKEGQEPLWVVTGANFKTHHGSEGQLISKLQVDNRPMLLIFGTGWGLHASVIEQAHFMLNPIWGNAWDNYNHLSVRSAVAIYLDRLNSAEQASRS